MLQLNGNLFSITMSLVFNIQHSVTTSFFVDPHALNTYDVEGLQKSIIALTVIVFKEQANRMNSCKNNANVFIIILFDNIIHPSSVLSIIRGRVVMMFFIAAAKCILFKVSTSSFASCAFSLIS